MSNLSSFRLIVFTLIAVIVAMAAPAWAQKDAGSIVGTVRDQSGAVVSHAKVTVADVERGSTFEATTNDAGEYVASPLRVGQYTVTVEHSGFKKAVSASRLAARALCKTIFCSMESTITPISPTC